MHSWQELTDGTNLMPEVPKALRDASVLVYEHGVNPLSPADQRDLLQRLNSSPPVRVQRDVRAVLNSDRTVADKIRQVRDVLLEAGVVPAQPPEPLPPLEPTDIHLIAWMAVAGPNESVNGHESAAGLWKTRPSIASSRSRPSLAVAG